MKPGISLIGAPTDIGAGSRGASMGPEALRVAGLQPVLESLGLQVTDRGNLAGPANPWLPAVDGYRHLPEVLAWNQVVHDAVLAALRQAELPILLGGDHCLGLGSISAVARHCREAGKKLRVLWLDAHADFNTRELTPSGNLHGMPVACLCGLGPQALIEIGGHVPAIQPKWLRQIGIRSVDAGEKQLVHQMGLEVFDMRYIDEMGMRQAMELALATIDSNTHLHVSFDVDFLDPAIAPGVATTVPGGPTYRSPAVHGDDCRHRAAGVARRDGAQPRARPAQPDRRTGGGPAGQSVWQEHADACSNWTFTLMRAQTGPSR